MSDEAREAIDDHIYRIFGGHPSDVEPAARYRMIAAERSAIGAIDDRLAELGKEALAQMEADGRDRAAIAREVGLSRARVGQILGPKADHRKGY